MRNYQNQLCALASLLLLASCDFDQPEPGKQVWVDNGYAASVVDGYWLYLPEHMEGNKKYPVILFLQGGYGASSDRRTSKNDGPAKFAMAELKNAELAPYVKDSFLIINPHMKIGPSERRQWAQYDRLLLKIVEEVVANYQGDNSRIYLTGLSRGGHGSWGLLKKHPGYFAAVVPIAGRITCKSSCDKIKDVPMWIVHNTGDKVVGYTYASNTVDYFEEELGSAFIKLDGMDLDGQSIGASQILSTFQQEGHDAWNKAYSSSNLYKWMLRKSL